ncbi:hypothetical protein EDC94DRAFT_660968 [Helicostylum pulchrum]|nr:hypothetical protein EDC94DRAFT_660968 [Helicostylum pulchrum]
MVKIKHTSSIGSAAEGWVRKQHSALVNILSDDRRQTSKSSAEKSSWLRLSWNLLAVVLDTLMSL